MSLDTILAYVTGLSHVKRLEFQAATQCGPVLKGVKASNMMTVARGSYLVLQPSLKSSGIVCTLLFTNGKTEVLLLYRPDLLTAYLMDRAVGDFLKRCGYGKLDTISVILELQKRYGDYSMKRGPFPHELGLVLEYPVKDVEGFMLNKGENALMSGYWKVYHNKEEAEARFRLYDLARETAMRQVMEGWPLEAVAAKERRMNYE